MSNKGKVKKHPVFKPLSKWKTLTNDDFVLLAEKLSVPEIHPKYQALIKGYLDNYQEFENDFPNKSCSKDKQVLLKK